MPLQLSVDLKEMRTAIGIMGKLAVHGQIIVNIGYFLSLYLRPKLLFSRIMIPGSQNG
jgi:hypothetical protein